MLLICEGLGEWMKGMRWDIDDLLGLGKMLDERPQSLGGVSVAMWMSDALLRVRDRMGEERSLRANAVQREFERQRTAKNIVLKARQMGMTTWVAGRFFLKTITQPGVLTVQVAHTRDAAESIFRVVQRFWECLPEDLREGALRLSRSNAGQMRFAGLDSEFRVLSAGDENAGRGLTITNLHLSETSRWTGEPELTMAGLRAAMSPAGELVIESTPNGAYGCFHDEWRAAEERGVQRHFFPWWMEPAYVGVPVKELTEEERGLVKQHGLSRSQIGFRRELERAYRGMRSQEFAENAETCFRTSGEACFDVVAIEQRMEHLEEPIAVRHGGAELVWLPPVNGRHYLVAVDAAGGGAEGDYAVIQVVELQTGLQCAEVQRRMGTLETAERAAALGREYGRAMVVVERNNHGAGVLAYLDSRERYPLIYETNRVTGWPTTAMTKPAMVSRLGALLTETPWLFRSRRFLRECRSYVTLAGGGTGAASGAHDDCVMAMAVAHAVRAELLERESGRDRTKGRGTEALERMLRSEKRSTGEVEGWVVGGGRGAGNPEDAWWGAESANAGSRR